MSAFCGFEFCSDVLVEMEEIEGADEEVFRWVRELERFRRFRGPIGRRCEFENGWADLRFERDGVRAFRRGEDGEDGGFGIGRSGWGGSFLGSSLAMDRGRFRTVGARGFD